MTTVSSSLFAGLQAYEKLGVPQKKLVLGVPWYGYVYQCDSYQEEVQCLCLYFILPPDQQ